MATTTIEVWACVDADGDYAVGATEEAAREKYEEDFCPLSEGSGFRLVKVNVTVPLPTVIELEVEAPDETDEAATAAA